MEQFNFKNKKFYKYFSLDCHKLEETLSALAGMYFWLSKPSDFGDSLDNPWSFSKGKGELVFKDDSSIELSEIRKVRTDPHSEDIVWREIEKLVRKHFSVPVNKTIETPAGNVSLVSKSSEEGVVLSPDSRYLMFELQKAIEENIGILSFSDSPTNSYNWDKFASGHRGICLEFEFVPYSNHTFSERFENVYPSYCKDVVYTENLPSHLLLKDILQDVNPEEALARSLFEKNALYKSENEWRLVEYSTNEARCLSLLGADMSSEADMSSFPGNSPHSQRVFREFRHFRITKCILGREFPRKHLDIVFASLPPHVEIDEIFMGNDGLSLTQDQKIQTDSGKIIVYTDMICSDRKHTAGIDRKVIRDRNERSIDEKDPDGLRKSGDGLYDGLYDHLRQGRYREVFLPSISQTLRARSESE